MGTVDTQKLVDTLTIAPLDAGYHVETPKEIQGAVDGRDVHGGTLNMDPVIYLLGRGKAFNLVHDRQYHLPLRGEAESTFAEFLEKSFSQDTIVPLWLLPSVAIAIIVQLPRLDK